MIEDVVRSQVVELVSTRTKARPQDCRAEAFHLALCQLCRARCISHLRSSRFLTIDDLIFLIREERGKVNRLRNYLSWKEVRKKAKSDDAATGGAGADIDMDEFDVAGGSQLCVVTALQLIQASQRKNHRKRPSSSYFGSSSQLSKTSCKHCGTSGLMRAWRLAIQMTKRMMMSWRRTRTAFSV